MRRRTSAAGCLLVLATCACNQSGAPGAPTGTTPVVLQTLIDVPVLEPLADVTAGSVWTTNYAGQSMMVPAGTFDYLRFNWYGTQKQPKAFGVLYLLAQEYLGLPGDLGAAAGLVARSDYVANGEYVFRPEVVITGPRQYWVYTDTQGDFGYSFDLDLYPGGDGYVTGVSTYPYHRTRASGRMVGGTYIPPPPGVFTDTNFRLRGNSGR